LQLPSVSSDNGEKELVEVEEGGQQETTPSPFPSTVNPFPFWLLKSLSGRREASAETEGREEVVGEGGNGTSVAAAEKEARGVGEEKEAEERIEGGEEAGGRPVFKGIDYERLERDSELLRNVHVVRDKTEVSRSPEIKTKSSKHKHTHTEHTHTQNTDTIITLLFSLTHTHTHTHTHKTEYLLFSLAHTRARARARMDTT
jgi:hypothetical protein